MKKISKILLCAVALSTVFAAFSCKQTTDSSPAVYSITCNIVPSEELYGAQGGTATVSKQGAQGTQSVQSAKPGETITLTANPNVGWIFSCWGVYTVSGRPVSVLNDDYMMATTSFTMPAENVVVTAYFAAVVESQWQFTQSVEAGGTPGVTATITFYNDGSVIMLASDGPYGNIDEVFVGRWTQTTPVQANVLGVLAAVDYTKQRNINVDMNGIPTTFTCTFQANESAGEGAYYMMVASQQTSTPASYFVTTAMEGSEVTGYTQM